MQYISKCSQFHTTLLYLRNKNSHEFKSSFFMGIISKTRTYEGREKVQLTQPGLGAGSPLFLLKVSILMLSTGSQCADGIRALS